MTARKPLEWDTERSIPLCGPCASHLFDQPLLVEACASVGIEHGKSTGQMLREYIEAFHRRRHKPPP